ncbi:hypothetical protein PGT21_019222 [Puccinia graminis f. sp. tritici]|uniref:Uncharacterized protein n=1 Tax=Puccinia graminis f. sp. tritici TaxID=56615 RepID=A0A5B0Q2Z8_PUCGR|nr:hypothetical protein PGT21_019222 [Puccinia graminis f. sp. tritici]KAA1124609.1 hypothetical protein PGTUg99_022703 [Puccinia graminis f. sp. tritici]
MKFMYHQCVSPKCHASTKPIQVHTGVCGYNLPECTAVGTSTSTLGNVKPGVEMWQMEEPDHSSSHAIAQWEEVISRWKPKINPKLQYWESGSQFDSSSVLDIENPTYGPWENDPKHWHQKDCKSEILWLDQLVGRCSCGEFQTRRYSRIFCMSCKSAHPLSYTSYKCKNCRKMAPVPPQNPDWVDWTRWLQYINSTPNPSPPSSPLHANRPSSPNMQ